jgi:hypothetical protein
MQPAAVPAHLFEGYFMSKSIPMLAFFSSVLLASAASAQDYPILDKIAAKVVAKYQAASCEQLWQQKSANQPASPEEQRVIAVLKGDPQMQQAFFNKVAVPIATRMFQCGLIP